jgi:glycosyltransferase involved in cell wall biosynthesis
MAKLMVIVSYKVFPAQMGGQKGIVKFFLYLKKYHSIQMVASFENEVSVAYFPVEKMLYSHRKMALNIRQLFVLRKKIKKDNIDCVVAEHSYTGWMAYLLKKLTGKPFVIHSHNIEASRFRQIGKQGWKLYRHYEKWIHRKADFNFFITEEDQQVALQQFGLPKSKCAVIPYGIDEFKKVKNAENKVKALYGIESTYLFYFNGTLDYLPNTRAVENLIDSVCPLLDRKNLCYTLVISGNRLSPMLQNKIENVQNIRYLGFVDDVEMLYQASDLFLNPVINDSGVKTKVIEALANHCTVVSTESGATGIPCRLCGDKLKTAEDNDWKGFVNKMVECLNKPFKETPATFFYHFSWNNIAQKAAEKIEAISFHA